mgnify:CR=1 FL=1
MLNVFKIVNSRFSSNTFIVSHVEHNDVWVVDPGDTKPIFEWIRDNEKSSVVGIFLTHAHFDHIYGVNEIISLYPSCIVYIANEYGFETLRDSKKNGSRYTEEGAIEIIDDARIVYYSDIMQLWNEFEMKTINTPGHSDDSQCLLLENMLFTGDTLIKDVRTVTKLKGGSVEKLGNSMKIISLLKGYNLRVMPGHGEEFSLDGYNLQKMIK